MNVLYMVCSPLHFSYLHVQVYPCCHPMLTCRESTVTLFTTTSGNTQFHELAGIIYHPTILIIARVTSLVLAVFEELSVSETSVSSIDKAIVP